MNHYNLIGRSKNLFEEDLKKLDGDLSNIVSGSKFLVVGGAGTIGQAVTNELFMRDPKLLHVVDISENNLVELVRDLRSSVGYGSGEFKTFAIDCGSLEFDALVRNEGPYDYVFNLSALKHVRSEKDPYTLMRMIRVNILNSIKLLNLSKEMGAKKYFCVSTDKAANPVNMMGATKKIMEMFMMRECLSQEVTMARFANVAFSDGSLLHGFNKRFEKKQPFSAPHDIKRYFVTQQEAGELCMLSGLLGQNRDIFFPKLSEKLHLISFSQIALNYLRERGFEAIECKSEDYARRNAQQLIDQGRWPCYFFKSDTTGEKDFEEFYTDSEDLDMAQFSSIGVIKNKSDFDDSKLTLFFEKINFMLETGDWTKPYLIDLFHELIPNFLHEERGKYLDQRM